MFWKFDQYQYNPSFWYGITIQYNTYCSSVTGADEKEGGRSLVLALLSWNIVAFNILYQKNKKIIHSNTAFSGVWLKSKNWLNIVTGIAVCIYCVNMPDHA